MRYINREVRIREVAHALDFKFDGRSKIHCWHPDRHKHGDRTASVGIRTSNNTVKCFGCVSKPMGPIDLVMDVLDTAAADAALWIALASLFPQFRGAGPFPSWTRRIGSDMSMESVSLSGLGCGERYRKPHGALPQCFWEWLRRFLPQARTSHSR